MISRKNGVPAQTVPPRMRRASSGAVPQPRLTVSAVARSPPSPASTVFRPLARIPAPSALPACAQPAFHAPPLRRSARLRRPMSTALRAPLRDFGGELKDHIRQEVSAINGTLNGAMSINRKRPLAEDHEDNKENVPIKYPYVPKCNWVFQTPPNRKLNYSHVKVHPGGECLQPAVLENGCDKKTVYEVSSKVKIDLSRFVDKEVAIDKRFMTEVTHSPDTSDRKLFKVPQQIEEKLDPYELEHHFLSLTCRPKKSALAVSKQQNLKRKRDIFEQEPGCSSAEAPLESGISYIQNMEESYTFNFTSTSEKAPFDFDAPPKRDFNFHF